MGGETRKVFRSGWQTFALFIALCLSWALTLWLGLAGRISPWSACLVSSLVAYCSFTPLHEAIHQSLSGSRLLNGIVGRIAAFFLIGPFVGVRRCHLEHHRHTNVPGIDPDHWVATGRWWTLPFRWLTLDLHFHWRFVRRQDGWPRASRAENSEVILTLAALAALIVAACLTGYGWIALFHWIIPARVAVTALAFAFDYLPHRPHSVVASEDKYRATQVIDSRLLNVLFLGQNYHLIHHLYPGIPFHGYRKKWQQEGPKLRALGARELVFPV
jgi:beta-carotene hydroxylase